MGVLVSEYVLHAAPEVPDVLVEVDHACLVGVGIVQEVREVGLMLAQPQSGYPSAL
jgi:hypothetical protein